jgi:hypothetical protein
MRSVFFVCHHKDLICHFKECFYNSHYFEVL